VADWTVTVTAADGTVVRSFAGNGQFVTQTWDGLDAVGVPVPDGTYTITGTASTPATPTTPAATATPGMTTVVVDTQVPTFTGFLLRSNIINPEGAGVGDRVSLSYALSEPGSVQVVVKDATGAQVRLIQAWTLVLVEPRSLTWDGLVSKKGKLVPADEGQYTIEADATDAAGNPCSASGAVTVDRTIHVTSVQPMYLSPNGDGRQDVAAVTFELRRSATVSVSVLRSAKSVLTASLGSLPTGIHTFEWKGTGAAGKLAAGGAYSIVFTADTGQVVVQAACAAVVDLAGPRVTAGSPTVVKRRHAGATTFVARDKQSAKVHVIAIVKSATGKTLTRVDCGWVASGASVRFTYKAPKPGLYAVWFSALDQGGNRQLKCAIWRLRVKK
jgi:flagellar hook assembly protein FlgD